MNMTSNMKYLLKEAAKGNHQAEYLVGYQLCSEGCSDVLSQAYLRKAAAGNYTPAQRMLGILGICGRLLTPDSAFQEETYYTDLSHGANWLHIAAKHNDPVAAFLYAKCMQKGVGLVKDEARAEQLLADLVPFVDDSEVLAAMMLFDRIETKKNPPHIRGQQDDTLRLAS